METLFDGVTTPLKIDISTGDAITPRGMKYSFKLMLEERTIEEQYDNDESVEIKDKRGVLSKLDLGIVKHHFEVGPNHIE